MAFRAPYPLLPPTMTMNALWLDLRLAARGFLRARYVTIVSVLSIGLGVGAATAVFSWMDGLVLHPFPATTDQTRLVGVEVGLPNGGMGAWSYQSFKELRDGLTSFSGMAAFRIARASVRHPGENASTPLLATLASGRYFDVLGVKPVLGRIISDADEREIAPVAVLGYQYWMDRYGGSSDVLGKSLFLNGEPFTIIGVAPPRFSGVYTGVVPHMYVPLTWQPRITGVNALDDRKLRTWLVFARLAPGVSLDQAQKEADAVAKRIGTTYGDHPAPGAEVMELRVQFLGKTLSPLFTAMLAVTILLVVLAAANVAGLLLVRADARQGEIALRLALGASRGRLVQIVLAESALLAAAGSAIGITAAEVGRGALYFFVPRGTFPISLPIPISWRVLGVALLGAVAVTFACALAPALAGMRVAPQRSLRTGARSLAIGGSRLRAAIVAGQLSFCMLLLVLAGMFVRGLRSASAVDVGFRDPAHVLLVDTDLRAARVTDTTGVLALEELLKRIRALPEVQSASAATMVPLGFGGRRIVEMKVEGYAPDPDENMTAERAHVGSDYAAAMKIAVVSGRDVRDDDRAGSLPVALVNEAFARRFFAGADPIGRRIDAGRGWATIVGVLHDGKYDRLDEPLHPVVYVPLAQFFVPALTIHVRTAGDPLLLADPVRRALVSVHVDLAALQPRTLAQHTAASTFTQRTGASVLGGFALCGLLLAIVGLYGVLAFAVTLRARELAIRLALGARRAGVVWVVGRHALTIAGIGVVVGGALSLAGSRMLRSQVAGTGAADPAAFAAAAVVLVLVAAAAAWIPARRATRLDPAVVLRGE
jgi:putative ABC transport system permease protein